jgi:hypothetical protein
MSDTTETAQAGEDEVLLPCPFCGGRNIDPAGWASIDRKGPACDDCSGSADTVALWNSRPAFTAAPAPAAGENPLWQKLRDMLGLDGWHDGHYHGVAAPEQIVTHVQHIANERARLLHASVAPAPAADSARLLSEYALLRAGAVVNGKVLMPIDADEDMLASTCDDKGRMRLMEFTQPEERSLPFMMPRYAYRAIVDFVRRRATNERG